MLKSEKGMKCQKITLKAVLLSTIKPVLNVNKIFETATFCNGTMMDGRNKAYLECRKSATQHGNQYLKQQSKMDLQFLQHTF